MFPGFDSSSQGNYQYEHLGTLCTEQPPEFHCGLAELAAHSDFLGQLAYDLWR